MMDNDEGEGKRGDEEENRGIGRDRSIRVEEEIMFWRQRGANDGHKGGLRKKWSQMIKQIWEENGKATLQ